MSIGTSPEVTQSPRAAASEGRLLRVIGIWGLAAGIVNVTVGGGIFRLPSGVYAQLGGGSPISYLVCAVMMGLVVTCFAEAGSRVPLTGGLYAYIEVAFGPLVGFTSGFLLWVGLTTAVSAVASFFGDAMAALLPALAGPLPHALVIIAVLVSLGALNAIGIANATRFNTAMTVAKITPLLLMVGAGVLALHPARMAITIPSPAPLARASLLLIFAFLGVESALVPTGEVRDPERTVPRAIAIALGTVFVGYVLVQLVAQSALGDALAGSKTPVADAAGALMGEGGRKLILIGTTMSMFGYVSGMTLAVPRLLYAFGRDGFVLRSLGAVHPTFRTPHIAIAVQTTVNIILATTGTFEQLAILSNGSVLLVYAACAIAVLQLRRRNVRTDREPFVAPFGGVVPILAFAVIAWLLWSLTGKEWLALAIVIAAALLIYTITKSARAARTA